MPPFASIRKMSETLNWRLTRTRREPSAETAGWLREVAGSGGVVLALDRSLGMLRRAPADVPRFQTDAARLPLADANADVVVLVAMATVPGLRRLEPAGRPGLRGLRDDV